MCCPASPSAAARPPPVAVEEEDEEWPANPWQAQANAHFLQLQQGHGNAASGAEPDAQSKVFGILPVLCDMAMRGQSSGIAGAQLEEELSRRVNELEGQVALLEDVATRKELELAEVHARLKEAQNQPRSASKFRMDPDARVDELQQQNQWLSVVVSRFERKTMALEEELVALTLAGQAAELRAPQASVARPGDVHPCGPSSSAGEVPCHGPAAAALFAAPAAAAIVQNAQAPDEVLSARLAEFECQLAVCEASATETERRGAEVQAGARAEVSETLAASACQRAEFIAEVEACSRRNAFLSGIVSRYENKTIELKRQVDAFNLCGRETEANAELLAAYWKEELEASRCEAEGFAERQSETQVQVAELVIANAQAAEELSEQREDAKNAAITLRDIKKEHNNKMQALLRRMQFLETHQEGYVARQRAEPAVAVPAAGELTTAAEKPPEFKELIEIKDLNMQVVERLNQERVTHAKARECLASYLQENDTLSSRLSALSDQLYESVVANESLHEELIVANSLLRVPRITLEVATAGSQETNYAI